jgi:hypothetical protein
MVCLLPNGSWTIYRSESPSATGQSSFAWSPWMLDRAAARPYVWRRCRRRRWFGSINSRRNLSRGRGASGWSGTRPHDRVTACSRFMADVRGRVLVGWPSNYTNRFTCSFSFLSDSERDDWRELPASAWIDWLPLLFSLSLHTASTENVKCSAKSFETSIPTQPNDLHQSQQFATPSDWK